MVSADGKFQATLAMVAAALAVLGLLLAMSTHRIVSRTICAPTLKTQQVVPGKTAQIFAGVWMLRGTTLADQVPT